MKKVIGFMSLILPFMGMAQTGSEIYLFDMKVEGKSISLSNPINFTQHKGYDNQPFFARTEPVIYYASAVDTGVVTDVKAYNYKTKKTIFITNTKEKEYSPTLTPDNKFISCIIQRESGAQDLGKYPVNGGQPLVLINHLKVGYHSWMDENRLLLFILDDTSSNSLHLYNLVTKEDKVIIKKPGRSLHQIPGQDASSFVDKSFPKEWLIKKLDNKTFNITLVAPTISGHEDYVWANNGQLIMSDGQKFYSYQPGSNQGWQMINFQNSNPFIKGITRMAINADNTKLAVVVSE